jgi:hypothetical protein
MSNTNQSINMFYRFKEGVFTLLKNDKVISFPSMRALERQKDHLVRS